MSNNPGFLLLLVSTLAFPALAQARSAETSGAQSPAIIAELDDTVIYRLGPDQVRELTPVATAGTVGPLTNKIVNLTNRLAATQGATLTIMRQRRSYCVVALGARASVGLSGGA